MLSNVELNERLRTLNIIRRMEYSLLVAVVLVAGFVVTSALAILLMTLLVQTISGGVLVIPEDMIFLGFPVMVAFLLTNGLIGLAPHEGVLPGETISRAAKSSLRTGIIKGFIVGAAFGFFWALIFQNDLALYTVLIGLAIAIANGLFNALSSVTEPVCLKLVQP